MISYILRQQFRTSQLHRMFVNFWKNCSGKSSTDEELNKSKPKNENTMNLAVLDVLRTYPFIFPGCIGPAWYDLPTTMKRNLSINLRGKNASIECQVHSCPLVLVQTVEELFPDKNSDKPDLSIVTLTVVREIGSRSKRMKTDIETEKLAQLFVLAAKEICRKLYFAGHWVDFINPFSGRPYMSRPKGETALYKCDTKFRCLDFQVVTDKSCKLVKFETELRSHKKFVGNLFTNAPSKKTYLNPILDKK